VIIVYQLLLYIRFQVHAFREKTFRWRRSAHSGKGVAASHKSKGDKAAAKQGGSD
jgi:hypothetical protein